MPDAQLLNQLAHAKASRDYCLVPPARRPEDVGPDILWLMGWADWAVEADLIEEKLNDHRRQTSL